MYWSTNPSAVRGQDTKGKPTGTGGTYDTLNHERGNQSQYTTLQRFEVENPLTTGIGYSTIQWDPTNYEDTMADYDSLQKTSKL